MTHTVNLLLGTSVAIGFIGVVVSAAMVWRLITPNGKWWLVGFVEMFFFIALAGAIVSDLVR